jgi:alpha-tubulin suppressor-like RCC1 family protein
MPARPVVAAVVLLCTVLSGRAGAETRSPMVAFGSRHAVALRDNGDVLTWGDNVMCQLGRGTRGNTGAVPTVVLRNATAIAAASDHSLALTADGRVYGWGMNAEGVLGTGDTNDQCEGPALVTSLAGQTATQIATGYGFSVALTSSGDLYCTGDNSMGQCPVSKALRIERFTRLPNPELAGNVADVATGLFHTLVRTRSGRLYAFGRGRDGQLGTGPARNGAGEVVGLSDVVSFAAGTWHSVVARADGRVWAWGHNGRSQLCDGTTAGRSEPVRVDLPTGVRIADVAAGGHSTMLRATDGRVFVCGENQSGLLGVGADTGVPRLVPVPSVTATRIAMGGAHAAISTDGCAVRLAGDNGGGVASVAGTASTRTFTTRANLSLCGARADAPVPNLLREPPKGGQSNCWAPRKDEDGANSPAFTPLRQAMLAAEAVLKSNLAFVSAPEPVRFRTSMSAGPLAGAGARLHIAAVPERKRDGTRLWTAGCGVIPQIDRIGGAIGQVSIFFNNPVGGQFINDGGTHPKQTGTVAGFPEYNGWVLISKGGRLPWIPQTLEDKLNAEAAKRERALDDWRRSSAAMKAPDEAKLRDAYELMKKSDPAGAEKMMTTLRVQAEELARYQRDIIPATTAALEKQVSDLRQYRASFSRQELQSPAVWGDPSGEGKRRLDARLAELRKQLKGPRGERERVALAVQALMAEYDLTNLRPGDAAQAISAKPDPSFFDATDPNRIQLITVMFSANTGPAFPNGAAWGEQTRQTFEFAALAAPLR